LSSDEPYKLKEKIDKAATMLIKGLQEEPSSTREGMLPGTTANDVPMEQG